MNIDLPISQPPIETIHGDLLDAHEISLRVLRLDLIHPSINGNKWCKLKQNLVAADQAGLNTILSFGGAYSNHLRALAAAGKHFGFKTVAVVRGEIVKPLNPVLSYAVSQGMELVAMSRSDYRRKYDPVLLAQLKSQFGDFFMIPEGGSNDLGVAGCADIVSWLNWSASRQPRYVATACGTGATMAGLIAGLENSKQVDIGVIGVAVLKGAGFLTDNINQWLPAGDDHTAVDWKIYTDYHCGGYAKSSKELEQFLHRFEMQNFLPLEPVYTGKLFYGIFEMIKAQKLPAGCEILALHTGGVW